MLCEDCLFSGHTRNKTYFIEVSLNFPQDPYNQTYVLVWKDSEIVSTEIIEGDCDSLDKIFALYIATYNLREGLLNYGADNQP